MFFVVAFSLGHNEDFSYDHLYEILEKEFHLQRSEQQGEREVFTPHTTVMGTNSRYKKSSSFSEAIRDRLLEDDIILDRILVCATEDHTLIG